MNTRTIIAAIAAFLISGSVHARQNNENADSLSLRLQEVVVTARQPATKLRGTTLVSTISGSNLADLGNALDVLAQLPMLKVQDNSVSVNGRSNLEIYIDGRPMRDEQELVQILSSNMRKVELLMAPGAAYASTTDAVLKITTKRNFVQGLSFTDQLQVRRRRKWSVMDNLGLTYRLGNWELFAEGLFNHDNSATSGTTINSLLYKGEPTTVGGSRRNNYPTNVGLVKAGVNYARNGYSLGAYYRFNPERGNFSSIGTEWLNDNPAIDREIDKHIRAHSHLASVYFEKRFADKYLLHFDGDFRHSEERNSVATIYPESTAANVNSTDKRRSTLWAGKLYLSFSLGGGEFTAGTQDSYTRTSLDYRMLNAEVGEYIPSALTRARQTSAALFASWSRMFGNFSLTAGARYEYVDYDFTVNGKRDDTASRKDHLVTPDLSLSYSFNDECQLSLSYKLKTVKPPYSQLTGSLSYVGLHEIEGGNPALRDERMHNLQLFGMWKGFMLQADYTRALDTYAFVKEPYPADNLQLIMHPVNIDVSALSAFLVWSGSAGCWSPNVTLGMYRQWLTLDGTKHNRPIFSYYFDNTFVLPHGWTVTANMSGRTRGDMHTNRFGATWFTMDASVGKSFFNKSLTLKLSATDIFNTANNDWSMNTFGVRVDKLQSYDHRGVSLNVIYNFRPRKSAYRGAAASESELRRL